MVMTNQNPRIIQYIVKHLIAHLFSAANFVKFFQNGILPDGKDQSKSAYNSVYCITS